MILAVKQLKLQIWVYPGIILPNYHYEEFHSSSMDLKPPKGQLCLIWKPEETWHSVYISFTPILFYYPIWVAIKGESVKNAMSTEANSAFLLPFISHNPFSVIKKKKIIREITYKDVMILMSWICLLDTLVLMICYIKLIWYKITPQGHWKFQGELKF